MSSNCYFKIGSVYAALGLKTRLLLVTGIDKQLSWWVVKYVWLVYDDSNYGLCQEMCFTSFNKDSEHFEKIN